MLARNFSADLQLEVLHVYTDPEPLSAALNMAVDEALLESVLAPTLRFYGWRQPSLSFGYFSRYADVADETDRRELVRRWTGGGIVLHGNDLTYSVFLPRGHNRVPQSSRIVYREIHRAVERALFGSVEVALALQDAPKLSDACFANPVRSDVLLKGKKIAGAAQRRTRQGLLHQGSIQYEALPPAFRTAFASALCRHVKPQLFSGRLLGRAQTLAAEKYGSDEWLRRR